MARSISAILRYRRWVLHRHHQHIIPPYSSLMMVGMMTMATIINSFVWQNKQIDKDHDNNNNNNNENENNGNSLSTLISSTTKTELTMKMTMSLTTTITNCSADLHTNNEDDDPARHKSKYVMEVKRLFSESSPKSITTSSDSATATTATETTQSRQTYTTTTANNTSTNTITSDNNTALHNQILLVYNVLTPQECQALCNEADKLIREGYSRDQTTAITIVDLGDDENDENNDDDDDGDDCTIRRISIEDMSPLAQKLSRRLLQERVLSTISSSSLSVPTKNHHCKHLLTNLGLSKWNDPNVTWEWASDEPTVNVYTQGGRFEPHRDGYALTVVVPLNNTNEFMGGGTEFFNDDDDNDDDDKNLNGDNDEEDTSPNNENNNSVIVRPARGTAVCFDGDMRHAGAPVISGKRYVFVASFGIVEDNS